MNYTCATPVDTDLTLRQVFDHARAPYRLWVNDSFVVFSPEIFVRITDGFIYSHPMKGTMDATLPDARERLLANECDVLLLCEQAEGGSALAFLQSLQNQSDWYPIVHYW